MKSRFSENFSSLKHNILNEKWLKEQLIYTGNAREMLKSYFKIFESIQLIRNSNHSIKE